MSLFDFIAVTIAIPVFTVGTIIITGLSFALIIITHSPNKQKGVLESLFKFRACWKEWLLFLVTYIASAFVIHYQ